MSTQLAGPLILNDDVLIAPVSELSADARERAECETGDFAVSRLKSRRGSKIVDKSTADLLNRFRQKRTVVEAVILFAREQQLDPEKVLEGAYPVMKSMLEAEILVPASNGAESGEADEGGSIAAGKQILDGTVVRVIQILDDTEVCLLSRPDGTHTVVKFERRSAQPGYSQRVRAQLDHEAAFLNHLGGFHAPKFLRAGDWNGRRYIETELIDGTDAMSAATEWRERAGDKCRQNLLQLALAIARTYAAVHERGVIHGDVHPGNVLVRRDGTVALIDFGLARAGNEAAGTLPAPAIRGGVPFYFEPEMAAASRTGCTPPPANALGEQHAVAALIYFLCTGGYWQDFRLGQTAILEDIEKLRPLTFRERGARAWPNLEAVLGRALSKDPRDRFPSMKAFADALPVVAEPSHSDRPHRADPLQGSVEQILRSVRAEGPWFTSPFASGPTASVNYGSAGVALGLLHMALQRGDSELLALSDLWVQRARRDADREDAFHNAAIEITPEVVGESSIYHSASGIHVVDTLVGVATADPIRQDQGVHRFLAAVERPAVGFDLTLGRSSILLGAALLLDGIDGTTTLDPQLLRARGGREMADLWRYLDSKPGIEAAGIEYLGIAHGWAGFLYASLQWCAVSGAQIPASLEMRLAQLARLATPAGRGLDWPWILHRPGEPMTMPGWCNGACGYVFLWTLAYRLFGQARYLELAERAAWRAWEAPDSVVTLCCGLAGRGFALLNIYRHTQDRVWLERARDLALRAMRSGAIPDEYPHSLYKGGFGLGVLIAQIEAPDHSAMPMFEPLGYSRRSGQWMGTTGPGHRGADNLSPSGTLTAGKAAKPHKPRVPAKT